MEREEKKGAIPETNEHAPSHEAGADSEKKAPGEIRFRSEVESQVKRKVQARKEGNRAIWFGLGMSGVVGWAVTIPALLGTAGGVWMDRRFPAPYSWTLMGIGVGTFLGLINAWYWIERGRRG